MQTLTEDAVTLIPSLDVRVHMKRDMDLVREILLTIQAKKDYRDERINIEGYDEELVARHLHMLYDAGMLTGLVSKEITSLVPKVFVRDLSWDGHDLLGALQNETVWAKIKDSLSEAELAGLSLKALKDIGVGLAKKYAAEKLGINLD